MDYTYSKYNNNFIKKIKAMNNNVKYKPLRLLKSFIFGAFIFFILPSFILAGTTGKIVGKIYDTEIGEPVIGANILVEGTFFGAAADIEGDFMIPHIPPGKYRIVISAVGYHKVTIENVLVKIDLTTNIGQINLTSEAISMDVIVVKAEQPLVTKDLTSTSAIVTSDEIKALPVDDFQQVVNLQAGVIDGHFRGGRSNEVAYLIDGVSVNDAFNGGLSVEVENNSIGQLEVISGTFNAEYGQAMSGVVNIITKDGGQKYEGNISSYVGNYFTSDTKIFQNLNKFNLSGPRDFRFNISGPTKLLSGLSFFVTGRYFADDGHMYGKRIFLTSDNSPIFPNSQDQDYFILTPSGDGKYIPMNPQEKMSFNGKITYSLPQWKFSYGIFWDDNWNKYYNHSFRLVPDAIKNHYRRNTIHTLQISWYPSQVTLSTLKFSHNFNDYWGYLYEDPFDSRYVDESQGAAVSEYTFRTGGNETDRYARNTKTMLGQWTLESQVSKQHKIKMGVEGRIYDIFNSWKTLRNLTDGQVDDSGNLIYKLGYSDPHTKFNSAYTTKPYEFSAYIQDKMEYDIMIINAGIRFDYFNPNTTLPADLRNPLNNPNFPGANKTRQAESEYQISPRFGVSFPMSDKGAIHFSYGHFFQIPSFSNLYENNRYIIDQTTSAQSFIGNPELKAQKTVKYELGLQQVVFPDVSLDISVYYSDIRNLLGSEIKETYEGFLYGRFVNRDYGNVKGLIVTLDKRFSNYFSAKLDYTYQTAAGNASDPQTAYLNSRSDPPVESPKKVVPLNWDQTSTLNVSLNIGIPGDWTIGTIFGYGSGMPYTEDTRYSKGLRFENGGRKPNFFNVDLRANKQLDVYGLNVSVFLIVYNLFDIRNEFGVSSTTGRAGIDLNAEAYTGKIYGLNTIEEYLRNPGDYSRPRQLNLGISVGF